MNRRASKITAGLVAALILMSVVPTAGVGYVDLRSPDARDAARVVEARGYKRSSLARRTRRRPIGV